MQLLKLLFHYVKIISSFKLLFKFISPVHSMSRRVQYIRICYMKGKIFKIKNAMVTFISIEYSQPKILTRNLHHHSPSYLAILFCHREKLARHVPTPRLSSEFCRTIQFSNCLVVCHYHDFSPKQLRSSEPFFNISVFLM